MKQYFLRRWFLYALLAVLLVGIVYSRPLMGLTRFELLRHGIVATVLFLMALPLEARAMWRTIRRPGPPLLAVGINSGLLPLFAWGLALGLAWLERSNALPVIGLPAGLLVAATTPCTLASASVWTRRAGGNDSVAILVTILTNLSCFLVTPLWLGIMLGSRLENQPDISLGEMIRTLGLLVVLPMVLAQLLRLWAPLAEFATRRKVQLGVLAQLGILSMILLGAIQTGTRLGQSGQSPLLLALAWTVAAVVLVHLVMFWAGMGLAQLSGFAAEDQIAVGFAGSQKTLMVGLQVAMDCGVTILPMVAYHVCQLVIDTVLADRFRHRQQQPRAEASDQAQ